MTQKVVLLENLIEAFPGSDSLPIDFRITGKADDPRLPRKAWHSKISSDP
jgi:hypothetical protein